MAAEIRIGQGVDIHPLVRDRKLVLGGVHIPFELGLAGHSDADALLHAVIDALLGAAGMGDIGTFFPNTDQRWKDADSRELLRKAWAEVGRDGWRLVNLDCSVVLERPKLRSHIDEMRSNIAEILGVGAERCAVKATTAEGLGFVGRGEGIFASCVALLERDR